MKRLIFLITSIFALFANVTAVSSFVNGSTASSSKYVVSVETATFHDAFVRCHQYGLDPAEIVTEDENKEVVALLQETAGLSFPNGFWIFATNLGDRQTYYWLNSGRPIFYSTFAPGQPDNSNNIEYCLEIYQMDNGVFAWNDIDCYFPLRFICQQRQKPVKSCNNKKIADL